MSEIPSLRTRNSKTYDLGRGEYRLDCGGDISHFQDTDGSWQDVDLSVSDTVPEGWTRYYSKNEWRVLIDTVKGRIAILPDRSDDTKYILFRAHPTNNVSINEEAINNKTIRCWRVGANESWNFLITDRGIKPYVYLYNTNASNTWTLGFTLNNLQRVGRNVYDGERLIGTLPNSYLIDNLGVKKAVTETIDEVAGTATLSWDHTGLSFPVIIDPTLTIQPSSADAQIYAGDPTTNYGSLNVFNIGMISSAAVRSVCSFNYAALPTDAIIRSAQLSFNANLLDDHITNPRSYNIHNLTKTDWAESEVTWNIYKTGSNWDTAGGDYTATPSATVLKNNNDTGFINWDVTSHLNTWAATKIAHFHLQQEEEVGVTLRIRFDSKESTTANLRPKLAITYELISSLYKHYTSVALIGRLRL